MPNTWRPPRVADRYREVGVMRVRPITFKQACEYVSKHHRHHKSPQGHKFSIGLEQDDKLIGVVMIGRPVARGNDNGFTAEIIRLCTDGAQNACSKLYAAAWNASKAMGYTRGITYILESENGASLKASGWKCVSTVSGRSWSCPSRPREDSHPAVNKTRWEITTKQEAK